ncbi:GNAT family N-acetyltransferase [Streptomyces silvensis]|uniref:Acetyltransferase n=1 Tax=Streptomyces silvensis TaxID=1765722 RepID=A0A0W7WWW5_9ACTN|nr:GNAT family N-acetyltransferase [Streptomyces silvensis]KUF15093.1 acetyltransferase [Streptomyces silvensis]
MIELRTLESDDWPLWRELRLAALAEAPYAFGSTLAQWQGSGDQEERWRARLSIPGARDLVAFLDGLPVGMVSGVPVEGADSVELISMWVSPAARGKGVGDHLVRAVERWGAERGAGTLRLSVVPDNSNAVALYERNGFTDLTDTGEPGDPMSDGIRRERVLAKRLVSTDRPGPPGGRLRG